MRAVLGIGGLLIVVAIVGIVAKKQLQAVGSVPSSGTTGASAGQQPASIEQARNLPKQVQQDVENALRQGAEARASEAAQ